MTDRLLPFAFLVAGFMDQRRGDAHAIGSVTRGLLALCSEQSRRAFYIISLEEVLREDWNATTAEEHRHAWSKISELLSRVFSADIKKAEQLSGTRIS